MPTRTFESYNPWQGGANFPSSPGFSAELQWTGAAAAVVETPAAHTSIVLARRSEFSPATGDPAEWKPAAGYGFGTVRLSRELGIGEVLSYKRLKQTEWAAVANVCGVNLFGGPGDELEIVDVMCVASLLTEEDEPDTGDEFTVEGRTFAILTVAMENEVGLERHMTLRGARAKGLTKKKEREGHWQAPGITTVP